MNLEKIKKNKLEIGFLLAIITLGFFLRAYHFSDWLHFEIDQTYDFDIVSPAIDNGISSLPLLGPNVGGGTLRLGPAFYYMEYISAKIFGNTPTGHAADVLILSILAIPLFYVFCKRYFSVPESMGLTTIFSTSLYCVMYSRFSWSPNVLPFLILFSFYALLRSTSTSEKKPALWFLLAVGTVTIASQIHFNSFFTIPLIATLFIAIKKPRFNWKIWLSALAIILVIYSPVILNDLKTHGQNWKDFRLKFNKADNTTLKLNPILQAFEYNAYEYFFINTSSDQVNGVQLRGNGFDCHACQKNLSLKLFAILILISSLTIIVIDLFKEKNGERKNFLILIILWLTISFYLIYTASKSYRIYPRFFLLMSPLAIITYGFILQFLRPTQNKRRLAIFIAIITACVFLNLRRINIVFSQLRNNSETSSDYIDVEDIFPDTNRITLDEQSKVADYIQSKYARNGYPVYISILPEYNPSLWSLLEKRGVPYFNSFDKRQTYLQSNYFTINYANDAPINLSNFSEKELTIFGKLRIQYFEPTQSSNPKKISPKTKIRPDLAIMSKLLIWKNIFSK